MKIYSIYDKVGKKHLSITLAETDADFIRSSLFAVFMDYPLLDIVPMCLGDFFEDNGIIMPCAPRAFSWNDYKFPKNADSLEEKYLTLEELKAEALESKKKFDQKINDKIEDFEKLIKDVDKELQRQDLSDKQKKDLTEYRQSILNSINTLKSKED